MQNAKCKIIPGKFAFCNSHFVFSNSPAAQQTQSTPFTLNSPYSGLFINPGPACHPSVRLTLRHICSRPWAISSVLRRHPGAVTSGTTRYGWNDCDASSIPHQGLDRSPLCRSDWASRLASFEFRSWFVFPVATRFLWWCHKITTLLN